MRSGPRKQLYLPDELWLNRELVFSNIAPIVKARIDLDHVALCFQCVRRPDFTQIPVSSRAASCVEFCVYGHVARVFFIYAL